MGSYIVGAAIIVAVITVIVIMINNRRKRKSGDGSSKCDGCNKDCSHCSGWNK